MARCMYLKAWSSGWNDFYACLSRKHPGYNANEGGTFFGVSCSNYCVNDGQDCPVFNNEQRESQSQNRGQY